MKLVTGDQEQVKLAATTALLQIAMRERRSTDLIAAWLQERGENADDVRRLLLAAAALGAEELPVVSDAMQRLRPHDPTPHVVRTQLPKHLLHRAIAAKPELRDPWLDEARKSLDWLARHAPQQRQEALAGFCEQLSALGRVEEAAELMAPAIAEAETVDDLSRLAWLANSLNNAALVRRTLARAAELAPTLQSSPKWSGFAQDMVFLSVSGRFTVVEDERTASHLAELGIAAIDASPPGGSTPAPVRIARLGQPQYVNSLVTQISHLQQQILQLRQQGANAAAVQSVTMRLQSLMSVYQSAMRSQSPSYGVVIRSTPVATAAEPVFPFVENLGISPGEILLVQTLVEGLRTPEHQKLLLDRLDARATSGPPKVRRTAVLARSYALWIAKKYDEAVAEFEREVEASPDDAALRLCLARAYDSQGDLPAVWEMIKPLVDKSIPEASEAKSLRERILRE
jgi:tetratricopeptide (TPR) repeat protein